MPPPFATGFVRPALTRFCGFLSFNSLSLSLSSSVVDFSGHALTFPYVHRCGLRSLRSRIATLLSALSRFRLCFRISFSSLFYSSISFFFLGPLMFASVSPCFPLRSSWHFDPAVEDIRESFPVPRAKRQTTREEDSGNDGTPNRKKETDRALQEKAADETGRCSAE